jgi:hypothetical protein
MEAPTEEQVADNTGSGTTVDMDYVGAYPSLAVGPDDRVHASYYAKYDWDQPGGGALRHAVREAGSWGDPESVDGDPYAPDTTKDVGQFSGIAVDGGGALHVVYWDVGNADLKYAKLPDGGGPGDWQIETVADLTAVCEDADLKLNGGAVTIGYCDGTQVLLSTKSGGWTSTPVAAATGSTAKVSLQIDGSGTLHAAYFDPSTGEIRYTSGSTNERVATVSGNETRTELVLDGSTPHVVFYDIVGRALKHAVRTGINTWAIETVDTVGDLSYVSDGTTTLGFLQLSALMDRNGNLHVSYFDGNNQDLMHAELSGGSWTIQTLATTGDTGRTSAMAEDSAGTIHIIYRDSDNDDLKYTYLQ